MIRKTRLLMVKKGLTCHDKDKCTLYITSFIRLWCFPENVLIHFTDFDDFGLRSLHFSIEIKAGLNNKDKSFLKLSLLLLVKKRYETKVMRNKILFSHIRMSQHPALDFIYRANINKATSHYIMTTFGHPGQ